MARCRGYLISLCYFLPVNGSFVCLLQLSSIRDTACQPRNAAPTSSSKQRKQRSSSSTQVAMPIHPSYSSADLSAVFSAPTLLPSFRMSPECFWSPPFVSLVTIPASTVFSQRKRNRCWIGWIALHTSPKWTAHSWCSMAPGTTIALLHFILWWFVLDIMGSWWVNMSATMEWCYDYKTTSTTTFHTAVRGGEFMNSFLVMSSVFAPFPAVLGVAVVNMLPRCHLARRNTTLPFYYLSRSVWKNGNEKRESILT